MGKVAAVLAKGKPAKVLVTTHGCELKSSGKYISAAVSAGILDESNANLINSFAIAKEKGFEVRNYFITNSEFSLANNTRIQTVRSCKAFIMAEEQGLYG